MSLGKLKSSASVSGRTTVCRVCGIDTGSYNLNYGVSSCLSCRAFFRRVVQQKMKTIMCCKGSGGSCTITPENRKRCKRCRFDACVAAGMHPNAVMSQEDFHRHFRKMIKKKGWMGRGGKKKQGQLNETADAPSANEEKQEDVPFDEEDLDFILESVGNYDIIASKNVAASQEQDEASLNSSQSPTEQASCNLFEVSREGCLSLSNLLSDPAFKTESHSSSPSSSSAVLKAQLTSSDSEHEKMSFATLLPSSSSCSPLDESLFGENHQLVWPTMAVNKAEQSLQEDDGFFRRRTEKWVCACNAEDLKSSDCGVALGRLHRDGSKFDPDLLKTHFKNICGVFGAFAKSLDEFKALPTLDQTMLLSQNSRLLAHYILSTYFFAGSGNKQLLRLLLSSCVDDEDNGSKYMRFVPIETFNNIIGLFWDDGAMKQYATLARQLSELWESNASIDSAIALICLFSPTTVERLEDKQRVKKLYELAVMSVGLQMNFTENDINRMVSILDQLSKIFDSGVTWRQKGRRWEQQRRDLCVFDVSSFWVRFGISIDAIPLGRDLLRQLIAFNKLGAPVSRTFFPRVLHVLVDRCKHMLERHGLPGREATASDMVDNVDQSVALFVSRLECMSDSDDGGEGSLARSSYDRLMAEHLEEGRAMTAHISLRRMTHLNDEEMRAFNINVDVLRPLLSGASEELFLGLVLLTLFGVTENFKSGGHSCLGCMMEKFLKERVCQLGASLCTNAYEELVQRMGPVKTVARLLKSVADQVQC